MRLLALLLVTAAVVVAFRAWQIDRGARIVTQPASASKTSTPVITPVEQVPLPSPVWDTIVRGGEVAPGKSHDRFRLAGTFFLMGSSAEGESGQRLAILDDVVNNRQNIVNEGQNFDGYEILRIHQDRLIMRRDGIEIELTLSFQDVLAEASEPAATKTNVADTTDEIALETSRFGKRIGEARWVMQKEALVDYYKELLDDPERIAAIYMSMKPDYIDGEIAGYRLEKEGEADFFDAVGLQEGDRIRKVNSMNMTSQARAEYFIGEFMRDRLGAVVIDVERNGKTEKLIYLFR